MAKKKKSKRVKGPKKAKAEDENQLAYRIVKQTTT
jgi:hypothetical protein